MNDELKYEHEDKTPPLRYKRASLDDFKGMNMKSGVSYFIHGKVGCGKTHLAAALANNDFKIDWDNSKRKFVSASMLLSKIRDCYNKSDRSEYDLIRAYGETPNLFLDDLGAEKITDWTASVLYLILDKRYNEQLRTVITSNYSISQLKDLIGERITSRILGMCEIVELTNNDRRPNEPKYHREVKELTTMTGTRTRTRKSTTDEEEC